MNVLVMLKHLLVECTDTIMVYMYEYLSLYSDFWLSFGWQIQSWVLYSDFLAITLVDCGHCGIVLRFLAMFWLTVGFVSVLLVVLLAMIW